MCSTIMFRCPVSSGSMDSDEKVLYAYALAHQIPVEKGRIDCITPDQQSGLRSGILIPVGSVEWLRSCMQSIALKEPVSISYPHEFRSFFHREIHQSIWSQRDGFIPCFIKPVRTKVFTGFVHHRLGDESEETLQVLDSERVFISSVVQWQCEWRYYVHDEVILGKGRYDDRDEQAPLPDEHIVKRMLRTLNHKPVAFSMDVGVLSTGETALVECNDAWSLGYYRGSLSVEDYWVMLRDRWREIVLTKQI